jgi:hypothetical protein
MPFDTALLNCHTYEASIAAWVLEKEVRDLAEHLKASEAKCDGGNPLWKYFGLTARAVRREIETPMEDKLDLIIGQVEKLRRRAEAVRQLEDREVGPREILPSSPSSGLGTSCSLGTS